MARRLGAAREPVDSTLVWLSCRAARGRTIGQRSLWSLNRHAVYVGAAEEIRCAAPAPWTAGASGRVPAPMRVIAGTSAWSGARLQWAGTSLMRTQKSCCR